MRLSKNILQSKTVSWLTRAHSLTKMEHTLCPTTTPVTLSDEMEKPMKTSEGKPWAQGVYHKNMPGINSMFINTGRSRLVNIFILRMLCWLLTKIPSPLFSTIFLSALGTGIIIFLHALHTLHI